MTKIILCVDDSASSRALMASVLKPRGYKVVQATDGIDGLAKMAETKVDLVITDLNMPKMNGIEMINSIRGTAQYDGVPLILLTAQGQKEHEHKCQIVGAAGWISKPLKVSEICNMVKRLIG